MASLTLQLDGLNCASCVARAEAALVQVPGVAEATVNLATAQAHVSGTADLEAVRASLDNAGYPARLAAVTLSLANMSCASCVGRAEAALAGVDGTVSARVNLAQETAQVQYVAGAVSPEQLAAAVTAAGYPATVGVTADEDRNDEIGPLTRRVWIAAALTLPVFAVEMGGHLYPPLHHFVARTIGTQTSWVLQFILTTFVLAGPGWMFFQRGLPALWRRAPDMNALVAVGTFAAWGFSTVATFWPAILPDGTRAVYFEAAAMIVTLILIGRLMEACAKGRAGAAIRALIGLQPKSAQVRRDGHWQTIPLADIMVGDIIAVAPGTKVATDGIVVSGDSYLDESMISGEPMPVAKSPGDAVIGGTINGTGALETRATQVGSATMLAQIVAMVQAAQGARLPVQDAVNRVTMVFVPVVMAIAALTVIAWLVFGSDPALALVAGVAVLIVACPCAMGLAVPTSIMVGTGRAAQLGVLLQRGEALQRLETAKTVVFDKTGTLTQGRPALTDVQVATGFTADAVLALAASAEAKSEHPLAQAIVASAQERGVAQTDVTDFQAAVGQGITAQVAGQSVMIGTKPFLSKAGITVAKASQTAATPVFVAVDGTFAATLLIADPIKDEAAEAIRTLHAIGLKTAMITGDTAGTAKAVAAQVGIAQVHPETLPGDKADVVASLGAGVVFVGDGINDAPALATADTGIAIGTGTDVAIESADVVLMSGNLNGVVRAITLSRRVMRNIRQNLFWAFAYNAALIPVAAGMLYPLTGTLLSPMLAAGAMALSSVFVVSNALRLQWVQPATKGAAT